MSEKNNKELAPSEYQELIYTLQKRFVVHMHRHANILWNEVEERLHFCQSGDQASRLKIWSLNEMERTGGEPDVTDSDSDSGEFIFYDCCSESPKGRRSLCYDREALDSRKEYKPINSALDMAEEMGVQILNEEEYRALQKLESFDAKTSSWLLTPPDIRKLGGAIFGDFRYGTVFKYHNGASSYYAARGFRSSLRV